ncbi:hypothetical protein, partial [Pseudomonas floridensis]|uniref:hypothetical protein n=1 Tax=Pseudomonas floridensis TaxID=1958950 RepID=UPI0039ED16C1
IHLDQETLFTGLLAFASVLGVGEGHLLHQASRRLRSGILPSLGGFFRVSLRPHEEKGNRIRLCRHVSTV